VGASQDATPLASGPDWSVDPVPGGYQVTKTLSAPIEIRDNVPTLWADGVDLGAATQSLDGLTLTLTTSDPAASTASDILQGWDGQDPAIVVPDADPGFQTLSGAVGAASQPQLAADPSDLGPYTVNEAPMIYDLGDEVETIPGFGGRKGEMKAAVWLPEDAAGARPVVVFLHGRHSSCGGGTANPAAWPCGADQTEIPSFLGYNDAAQILASQGYVVVSVSSNAINALDGSLADDTGALARAQLVMDHLSLLREVNAGQSVENFDPAIAAALTGKLDLGDVGLMGHSRGGEGVVRAALLNAQQGEPFGIKAVLPVAPTDYTRMTLPDVPTAVLLPYCDGDVEDQMGQKYIDDSRHAYDDDVLRSSVLVMGGNHNFFNSVWTPGGFGFGTADDWASFDRTQTNPVCGQVSPTRLTSDEQYAFGNAYISGFFQLTLGDQQQFLPMFDGSDEKPASAGVADVRVSATQPTSTRFDIDDFDVAGNTVQAVGSGTYATCESLSPQSNPPALPYCITKLAFAQAPDWGYTDPANGKATSVPSTPALHFTYTAPSGSAAPGEIRVPIPGGSVDASGYENLSFRVTPDDSVPIDGSTDLTVTVVDGSGGSASVTASSYGDALTVLPGSTNPLRKALLQQIEVPVGEFTGVDLSDIRQVRFTAPSAAGGVILSDLALLKAPSLGTPLISTRPFMSVADRVVDEGDGVSAADVAVLLSRPAEQATTAWFSIVNRTGAGAVQPVLQQVTFQPGELCTTVPVPVQGDGSTSTAQFSTFSVNVSDTQEGATIGTAFAKLKLREDDGVVQPPLPRGGVQDPNGPKPGDPIASAPAVGTPGDACAEALAGPGTLTVTPSSAKPGDTVTVTGSGFRVGESVDLRFHSDPVDLGSVISSDGTVSITTTVPSDAPIGDHEFIATGFGSAFTATSAFTVLDPDATPPPPTDPGQPGDDGSTPPPAAGEGSGDAGTGTSDVASGTSSATGGLASTGFQVAGWSLAAVALIGGGLLFFFLRRRRAASATDAE
jgi:dienelactone hydrolase